MAPDVCGPAAEFVPVHQDGDGGAVRLPNSDRIGVGRGSSGCGAQNEQAEYGQEMLHVR